MELRDYQKKAVEEVEDAWRSGRRNVMLVSPTGSGKTRMKAHLIAKMGVPACAIAHRQELVLQISTTIAGFGIPHNIIAPVKVVQFCVTRHTRLYGRSFYDRNAPVAVAGVNTLLARASKLDQFLSRVELWDIDEAHHCLPDNQWGRAVSFFPHAIGLGVTATPERCDRKALSGIFDHMVVGPGMRELIDRGYLSEYRIFCPQGSLDLDAIRVSKATGEYVHKDVVRETERSTIVGDVVDQYLKIAPGRRGLTFAVDVASATTIADAYNAKGVPAAVVSAKTPDNIRTDLLDRLARGDVKQLVNVDLFGEGMDCPALEVVSMARPTQSYGLYVQQFGRVLRTMSGKEHGIVIDHVGNVVRHGLPDAGRVWSLESRSIRRKSDPSDTIPLTVCPECMRPYESVRKICPYCGAVRMPERRSTPESVEGDLIELDPEVLARMRGERDRVDGPPQVPTTADTRVVTSVIRKWRGRQEAQKALRDTIAEWAGVRKYGHNEEDDVIHRRFWHTFKIDIMSAQILGAKEAGDLEFKIRSKMND